MNCFGTPLANRPFHYEQCWHRIVRCDWRGYVVYGPLRADGGW